jgi:hypothetical protein
MGMHQYKFHYQENHLQPQGLMVLSSKHTSLLMNFFLKVDDNFFFEGLGFYIITYKNTSQRFWVQFLMPFINHMHKFLNLFKYDF